MAFWPGARQFSFGPDGRIVRDPVADQPAEPKPLDDRLGPEVETNARWKITVTYRDNGGHETTEKAEIAVREIERSLRVATTPDIVVEMEAGRLARLVMRKR